MLKFIFFAFICFSAFNLYSVEAVPTGHIDSKLLGAILNSTWLSVSGKIHAVTFFKDVHSVDKVTEEALEIVIAHLLTDNLDENGHPPITQEDLDRVHESFPSTCAVLLEDLSCVNNEHEDCLCFMDYAPPSRDSLPPKPEDPELIWPSEEVEEPTKEEESTEPVKEEDLAESAKEGEPTEPVDVANEEKE